MRIEFTRLFEETLKRFSGEVRAKAMEILERALRDPEVCTKLKGKLSRYCVTHIDREIAVVYRLDQAMKRIVALAIVRREYLLHDVETR